MKKEFKFPLGLISFGIIFSFVWFFLIPLNFIECVYLEYLKCNHCTIFGLKEASWNFQGLIVILSISLLSVAIYYLYYKKSDIISKIIKFYSLIYGILLIIFSIFFLIGLIFSINTFGKPYPQNLLIGGLLRLFSILISGILLIFTFYGYHRSKNYSSKIGVIGSLFLIVGMTFSLFFIINHFAPIFLDSLMPFILLFYLPSITLLILIFLPYKNFKYHISKKFGTNCYK